MRACWPLACRPRERGRASRADGAPLGAGVARLEGRPAGAVWGARSRACGRDSVTAGAEATPDPDIAPARSGLESGRVPLAGTRQLGKKSASVV